MGSLIRIFCLTLFLFSCGSSDNNSGAPSESASSLSQLVTILLDGSYTNWAAEAQIHSATLNSPHGRVRSFYNDTLANAIANGDTSFPRGSIAVKAFYESNSDTVTGYAAMLKESEAGATSQWYWYEIFSTPTTTEEFEATTLKGTDLSICTGCHSNSNATDSVFSQPAG